MPISNPLLKKMIFLWGFLSIALGAFGAHAIENIITANQFEHWKTASLYHLVMTPLLLFCLQFYPRVGKIWLMASIVFSGSLYTLSITNISKLGAITPIGGLLFLWGWISLYKEFNIRDRA